VNTPNKFAFSIGFWYYFRYYSDTMSLNNLQTVWSEHGFWDGFGENCEQTVGLGWVGDKICGYG